MSLRSWTENIGNNTNRNLASGEIGWLAEGAGNLGGALARGITNLVPGALGDALKRSVTNAGMSELLGEVFANVPLAGFQKKLVDTFKGIGNEIGEEWGKADQAAFNYGKQVGLAAHQVARLRDEMIQFGNASQIGIKYNKSLEDLIKLQTDYSKAVGGSIRLTNEQLESVAAMSAVVGDDMAVRFSTSLENFGISASDAGSRLTEMYNKSVKQGISLETYAKNVSDHIMMAQKYTFKNGVDGLTSMAEKAAKMRVDMDMVASLADNLNNIEKSVNVSAQLQVLGGPFTQFADPMGLLHDSLSNMEGLQDRLTNLTKSLGRFNRQTGQIEIATFDKMRLREAASSMGVSYDKLIEQTTTQARRDEVGYQMRGLSNIPEEYKELIMNTATFKNGVAGTRGADGEWKALSRLDGNDLKALADYSKTDSENIADIAQMLRGYFDVQKGAETQIETQKAQKFAQQAASIKGVYDAIGHNAEAINKLIMIELASKWTNPTINSVTGKIFGAAKRTAGKALSGKANGGLIRTHSSGGYISDGPEGEEMILNSAQHGEFVINKQSTASYLPLLNVINGDRGGSMLGMMSMMGGSHLMGTLLSGMAGQSKAVRDIAKWVRRADMSTVEQVKLLERYGRIYKSNSQWSQNLTKATQTLSKVGSGIAKAGSKIVKFAGTKVGGGLIGGVMGGVNAYQGYKATGEDYMNRGKALGGTIGATAGGIIGGAIGSLAGPLGTMAGAAAGQAVGKWIGEVTGEGGKYRNDKHFNRIFDTISNNEGRGKFASLKGNYTKGEMKSIAKALGDGKIYENELDERLRKKLIATGNEKLLPKENKYARGGYLKGPSHANGGIDIANAEGGEFIINKDATAKSISTLTKINDGSLNDSNIKSREPMGKRVKVREGRSESYSELPKSMKIDPININISGTIKLDGGIGQQLDITKEMMNNPTFINKLTDMIVRQMNISDNGSFDKKQYYRRYPNI